MGQPIVIALKGEDTLTATLPGQPAIELMPYRGTTFTLSGLTGISLTFNLAENGLSESVTLNQPGMVLEAKRK
jgi:hypothetical protein